jgi:Fe-S cluster biosynthesis and repair protein YggX
MAAPPLPTALGSRIYDSVCQDCWNAWLKEQTALINHYNLNLLDPKAKQFLTEQTEAFFFGAKHS